MIVHTEGWYVPLMSNSTSITDNITHTMIGVDTEQYIRQTILRQANSLADMYIKRLREDSVIEYGLTTLELD